jgi:peptidoglycan/LPS O-acetylase OafA/YrhL
MGSSDSGLTTTREVSPSLIFGEHRSSGVDLFFVLSGYLIYGAVIRKKVSHLTFFRRRVERIYPTFLCVFAIYLVLSILFPEENKIPARSLAAAIYILQNALLLPGIFHIQPIITVAWSLSYELFYYLSLPVLVMMLGMRSWRSSRRSIFSSH